VAESLFIPRAVEGVLCLEAGLTPVLGVNAVGPIVVQPKFLRTKDGDLAIQMVDKRGRDTGQVGSGQLLGGDSGPFNVDHIDPTRAFNGNKSYEGTSSLLPDRSKGGRIKKAMKKTQTFHPYLPGSKHHKFYELSKGGQKYKKRMSGRERSQPRHCNSNESDPIDVSDVGGDASYGS
jgi:hypothetical protein